MLSERERRTLHEIEQQITEEDHRFAETMRRPATGHAYLWTRRGYDITIVLAVLSAVLCFALTAGGAAFAGVVSALLAGTAYTIRRQRFPRP